MDTDDQAVDALAHRLRFMGLSYAKRVSRFLIMKSETPLNIVMTVVDILGLDTFLFKLRKWLNFRRNLNAIC